jgi:hypothetical protein
MSYRKLSSFLALLPLVIAYIQVIPARAVPIIPRAKPAHPTENRPQVRLASQPLERLLQGKLIRKQTVGVFLLVALLWAAFAAATYLWFIPIQQKSDFLLRWYGAGKTLHGTNPYALYGTTGMVKGKGLIFVGLYYYPATIAYTLLPFWLLPANAAVSLWCGLQLVFFSSLPLLIYWNLSWKPSLLYFALIIVFSLGGFPYSLNVYALGQFTGLVLASLVLAWWGIGKGHRLVAALSLVLATTRPEGAVIAVAVLAILLVKRQFTVPAIWLAMMTAIFLLSLLQIGWWVPDFLNQTRLYPSRGGGIFWPPHLLGAAVVELGFIAGILLWGGWFFRQLWTWPDQDRQLLWGLSVVVVLALLLLPQTNDYTLVYLLLPIWLLAWRGRRSATAPVLFALLPVVSYFAKYGYMGLGGQAEALVSLNELVSPLVIAALLTYEWSRFAKSAPYNREALERTADRTG